MLKPFSNLLFFTLGISLISFQVKSQCIPIQDMNSYEIVPHSDSLKCIITGKYYEEILHFNFGEKSNFMEIYAKLVIDSIKGLPNGINYELNHSDNTYIDEMKGCINFYGVSYQEPGRYYIYIYGIISINQFGNVLSIDTVEVISFINHNITTDSINNNTTDTISRPFFDIIEQGDTCKPDIMYSTVKNSYFENNINVFLNKIEKGLIVNQFQFIPKRKFYLVNVTGQKVLEQTLYYQHTKINLSSAPPGLYIYYIADGDKVINRGRVVVK